MPKKLLILSQNAWRDDNSFGSTYSNIFKHIKNVQIANIYCESAKPKNNIVKKHFQISESLLIKNLINKNSDSGIEVFKTNNQDLKAETSTKAVRQAKKLRWQIFFWGRDLIWKIGRWKSKELLKFIDDFDADVLFFPLYVANHMNDIAYFIKKHTKKKLIFYVSDDVYTLKQFSLSPFYWINRFIARAKIKRVMKLCDLLYVISVVQKRDYEKIFNVPCKVLTKGDKFIGKPPIKKSIETPIKMVFTGNIGSGRWKMLGLVADALKRINIKGELAKLDIYTLTLLTEKMINALNIEKSSSICGGVSAKQVKKIQADADILVHVESFSLKETLKARQSLSTKLVDYFSSARCIFAVGKKSIASIDHLINNDAAIVASSRQDVYEKLNSLIMDKAKVLEYGEKAWECGKNNHQIDDFCKMIRSDLDV